MLGQSVASVDRTALDAVAALLHLADADSSGGTVITNAESAAYNAAVGTFSADQSVDALGVLARFQADPLSLPAVLTIANALRHHVAGLRISSMEITGLSISSCDGDTVRATFDAQGAAYRGVDIVYTQDNWTSVHLTALSVGGDGLWQARLPALDPQGNLLFAVALRQPFEDTLWLNNPRENRPGAVSHVDYRQALPLCEPGVPATQPPFVRLLQSYVLSDSIGGATVTADEFSWLVAQTTWEGGPGTDDPEVIDPMIAALDDMNAKGVAFEGNTYVNMRGFLSQMRMRLLGSSVVSIQRDPTNQYVQVIAPLGAQGMRVYYSTDGWNTPKVVDCTPRGRSGPVSCGLGYLPRGSLVSFSAIVHPASGPDEYVTASDGGNIFLKLP